jgi:trimeric autotransporter adhesin
LVGFGGERVERDGEKTEEVKLEWTTAQEIGNKGFEVQVSDNGLAYRNIAFVDGKGNSATVSSYQLAVNNANDGYYRLRQIDFDGKFSYSPVVFVEGVETLNVYPNPSKGVFTIAVGKSVTTSSARLLNAQGVQVWAGKLQEAQTTVYATNLPTGMYFLHTVVAGKAKVTKMVIER